MMSDLQSAQLEVIRRLLDAHERSASFGRPGPWPRDVILTIDRRTFPSAFAPGGGEELATLRQAIEALRAAGACRVVYERPGTGTAERLPHQVRVGPEEIARAYDVGRLAGFEPLSTTIERVRRRIRELQPIEMAAWFRGFLARADDAMAGVDPSVFGMGRERFKRDSLDLCDALAAAAAISAGVDAREHTLSERLFARAQRLSSIRSIVAKLLLRSDPDWAELEPEDDIDVLETYGVRRKPGILRCAGGGTLLVNGRAYELADFMPAASLPEAWGPAWCEAVAAAGVSCITTVENELPFLSYVEEAGGGAGLAARREAVIHVAGFPAPWLTRLLADAQRRTGATLRHWGDADVGGLLIWRLLRARVDTAIELFRTTEAWVRTLAAAGGGQPLAGGQPLTSKERAVLRSLHADFATRPEPDFAQAAALAQSLLETGTKIEQERGYD